MSAKEAGQAASPRTGLLRGRIAVLLGLCALLPAVLVFSQLTANPWDFPGRIASPVAIRGGGNCDMSAGKWVFDDTSYPLYREGECRFMSDQSACEKFGRTNLSYQHWRWQPRGCDLPRFDAVKLLERLSSRRLVFVGDSLNRNQWVSMVCLLDTATPGLRKSTESVGSLMKFKIQEYNVSVDFYWSPLLAESNSDHPVHHRIEDRIVRSESIRKHAVHWTGADVIIFNSYLWWRRPQMKVQWGSFEEDKVVLKMINSVRAYELVLRTWSDWLEFHVDRRRTRVFFMTMSPTHFWGDEWGIAKELNCYNETEPIAATEKGHHGRDSDPRMMRAVEAAVEGLQRRGVSVQVVNVTGMSEYRKDGHPAMFRKQWDLLTEEQARDPGSYADCIHWCLPGIPDSWNQMLYAHLVGRD